ncbi:hypothetical protein CUMW_166120 [Citrus unshiu]|uniref:Uncharacterized protein n=1 Tax=Citrus unshiu TaxID=55188 RepID=A0A2H5PTI5_CITUN|nr:hypothetical protein CUMW_166110 [Citrus unshiu]GAY55688.1 hypothetical protein CUMW_166120 [Citrus unshiu]
MMLFFLGTHDISWFLVWLDVLYWYKWFQVMIFRTSLQLYSLLIGKDSLVGSSVYLFAALGASLKLIYCHLVQYLSSSSSSLVILSSPPKIARFA